MGLREAIDYLLVTGSIYLVGEKMHFSVLFSFLKAKVLARIFILSLEVVASWSIVIILIDMNKI